MYPPFPTMAVMDACVGKGAGIYCRAEGLDAGTNGRDVGAVCARDG